jgi:hypothetical protein
MVQIDRHVCIDLSERHACMQAGRQAGRQAESDRQAEGDTSVRVILFSTILVIRAQALSYSKSMRTHAPLTTVTAAAATAAWLNCCDQAGLVYRAIKLHVRRHAWARALELAQHHGGAHIDTVRLYRRRYAGSLRVCLCVCACTYTVMLSEALSPHSPAHTAKLPVFFF